MECYADFVKNRIYDPMALPLFESEWGPENLFTFSIWPTIEKVYIFSGPHFILFQLAFTEPECSVYSVCVHIQLLNIVFVSQRCQILLPPYICVVWIFTTSVWLKGYYKFWQIEKTLKLYILSIEFKLSLMAKDKGSLFVPA